MSKVIKINSAKVYGESLYTLASEEKTEERILSELKSIAELFNEHPDYVKILDSPQIAREELMTILNEDFFGKVHRYTLNFLKLLSEKHMVHYLEECLGEYEHHYNRENNIHIVNVTTAKPVKEELIERLVRKLEEKTGGRIMLKKHIDESCIGGIIIETDKKRIDASIKTGLENMERALI